MCVQGLRLLETNRSAPKQPTLTTSSSRGLTRSNTHTRSQDTNPGSTKSASTNSHAAGDSVGSNGNISTSSGGPPGEVGALVCKGTYAGVMLPVSHTHTHTHTHTLYAHTPHRHEHARAPHPYSTRVHMCRYSSVCVCVCVCVCVLMQCKGSLAIAKTSEYICCVGGGHRGAVRVCSLPPTSALHYQVSSLYTHTHTHTQVS